MPFRAGLEASITDFDPYLRPNNSLTDLVPFLQMCGSLTALEELSIMLPKLDASPQGPHVSLQDGFWKDDLGRLKELRSPRLIAYDEAILPSNDDGTESFAVSDDCEYSTNEYEDTHNRPRRFGIDSKRIRDDSEARKHIALLHTKMKHGYLKHILQTVANLTFERLSPTCPKFTCLVIEARKDIQDSASDRVLKMGFMRGVQVDPIGRKTVVAIPADVHHLKHDFPDCEIFET